MQVMKAPFVLFVFSLLAVSAMAQGTTVVSGRTTYHTNNTRTETLTDMNVREMTEMTYDANNVLGMKKVFMLNDKGEPTNGNVYDAKGNLVARCQTLYDGLGRRSEGRLVNLNGEIFQRVIYEYDSKGKAKTPKVINIDAKAPSIRPGMVDMTQGQGGMAPSPVSGAAIPGQDSQRFAPTTFPAQGANSEALPPVYAPGAEPAGTTPAEPKKKSFWKRLLNKDK